MLPENDRDYLLGKNVRLVSVKVWETASCWAEYAA